MSLKNFFAKGDLPKTAFGEVLQASNYPYIQSAPVNNFLPANFRAYTTGTGTAGVTDRQFAVTTGTGGTGAYGAVQSFRSLNYKAGEGALGRFTGVFETGGVAQSWQGIGFINVGDELSFGYNGADFGVWHRHDGKPEVQTLTVTGAAGGSENATLTLDGTAFTIPLTTGTVQHNAYEIEAYVNANSSAWVAQQNDDTVVFMATSDGNKSGTMSFSSSTATASLAETTAGVTKTSEFVAQSKWNLNKAPWLDPTKGNVYQIRFQYLGYGAITYSVEDPVTGEFVDVHRIRYANSHTSPSLGNPSMHMGLYCVSLGSTTDISVKCASIMGASQGNQVYTRNPRSQTSEQTGVGTTLTNILSVRNKRVVNGLVNQQEIEPVFLSISNEAGAGNKPATVQLYGNPTFSGGTNFQDTGDSNLISEYDTTANTVSGGRLLGSFQIEAGQSKTVNLSELRLRVPPTLNLCVCGKADNGGSGLTLNACLTWYEDV